MDLSKMFATNLRPQLLSVTVFSISLTLLLNSASAGQTATRFWSDNSGSFSTEAELMKINPTSVTLKKTNQVVIEVPFSRLSKNDLAFVKHEISLLNGGSLKPPQQNLPKQSTGSNFSSRTKRDHFKGSPSIENRQQLAKAKVSPPSVSLGQEKAPPFQTPLRYAANSNGLDQEPPLAEPQMPDSVTPVVPSKDDATSLSGEVARLKPTLKSQNQFSLAHPTPKKLPVIWKSPEQPPKPEAKTVRKSFGEVGSKAERSLAKRTSYESPVFPNDFKMPETSSVSVNNKLRSGSFRYEAPPKPNAFEFDANENAKRLPEQTDKSDFFPPENEFIPNIVNNKEMKSGSTPSAEQAGENPESPGVNPDNESLSKNALITPATDSAPGKILKTATTNAPVSFGENPNEEQVFGRPPSFAPRATLIETSVQPDKLISQDSLAELPPRFRRLAEQAMDARDPTQVRTAIAEIQSSWPSTRYPAIVELVQKFALAQEASTRILAIETLAKKDSEHSLEWILNGIDDASFYVRDSTHKIIEGLSNPKLIPLLAERLNTEQRQRVALTLSKFGPEIESHVVSFASHTSVDTQLTACKLLGTIGTQKSIKALQAVVANSKKARVRLQATNAIDRINERSNPGSGLGLGSDKQFQDLGTKTGLGSGRGGKSLSTGYELDLLARPLQKLPPPLRK